MTRHAQGGTATSVVRAMVQTGPRAMELRELPKPEIAHDEALIRVEACGICGSDIGMYEAAPNADFPQEFPVIRGHEPVGVVEEIGSTLAARLGVAVGDRVAIDPFQRCGSCRFCLAGRGELCTGGQGRTNSLACIPLSVGSGLWGGFSTHLVATSQTVLLPVPAHVPPTMAAMFNVLGAGVKWGIDVPGTTLGSTVLVLGCGQRGLACAVAALSVGAELVMVTGLTMDAHKLALAKDLGVHRAIDVQQEDLAEVVLGAAPDGVDIVIDTTPGNPGAIADAVRLVRKGGQIVVGGMKHRLVDGVPIDEMIMKEITVKGVLGVGSDQYRRAISLLATTELPLERLQTHVVPLERLEWGIDVLAGKVPGEHPLNIVIDTA
jgi:threonine dehydrogenase-like Zn-dependent dehydrogenase